MSAGKIGLGGRSGVDVHVVFCKIRKNILKLLDSVGQKSGVSAVSANTTGNFKNILLFDFLFYFFFGYVNRPQTSRFKWD